MSQEHLTTAQVAERHRVSVRTVHRKAQSGELPFVLKLPTTKGAYIFDASVAAKYFKTHGKTAAAFDRRQAATQVQ